MNHHIKIDLGYVHYDFPECTGWGRSLEFEELVFFHIETPEGRQKTYYLPVKSIVSIVVYE